MKAISIRQPFAHLTAVGIKDVENRSWQTKHRGPLLIHALKQSPTQEDLLFAERMCNRYGYALPDHYEIGGLVGLVNLADCVETSNSPWYEPDNYAFILTQARPIPFIPYRGIQKLFNVEGYDHLWEQYPPLRARPIIRPPRSWVQKFQQRVDRLFAAK